MGCAFDFYSPGWKYRTYVVALIFGFYIIPLIVIFGSYIGVMHNSRTSMKSLLRKGSMRKPSNNVDIPNGHNKSCIPKSNDTRRVGSCTESNL